MILPAMVIVLFLMGVPKVAAEATAWSVDYTQSRLSFVGTQAGSPFEGDFTRFDADIHFDPEALMTSRVLVRIDMASVATGNQERDTVVRDRDWFDVNRYPEARFETHEIHRLGTDRYEVVATLMIRDFSQPVALPFVLHIDGAEAKADGELTIQRTDFGVGQGQWASAEMVGRDVILRFHLLARRRS